MTARFLRVRSRATVCGLPDEHRRRFWLHLLRNMIVKAVIRVGAGYFDRGADFTSSVRGTAEHVKRIHPSAHRAALHGLREEPCHRIL